MEKLKKYITNFLLVFSLVSIGFIFGKHSVKVANFKDIPLDNGDRVISKNISKDMVGREVNVLNKVEEIAVYYLHSSFRCATCNKIEEMTKKLIDTTYAKELKNGKIKWYEKDFQVNEELAQKYKVAASCVVVAKIENGKSVDYQRMDEVWTKMSNPTEFNKYISHAINSYLTGGIE